MGYGTYHFFGLSYCQSTDPCHFVGENIGRLAKSSVPFCITPTLQLISYTLFTTFYHYLPHPCLFCLCNYTKIVIFSTFGSGRCLLTGSRVSTHLERYGTIKYQLLTKNPKALLGVLIICLLCFYYLSYTVPLMKLLKKSFSSLCRFTLIPFILSYILSNGINSFL